MAAGDRAGARFGQYELRRLLGVGGMGEVYEAYDTVRDRVVAIKLLDVELAKSATYVERFRRESRTAARLQEPHVIPVHDWGEVDGVLYIDMRLVRGRDLKAYIHEDGPMPPADAVSVVEQVAAALDAAHETGLVHRDIKPGNIILTGELFAYLVDFGIAHTESDAQLTSTGSTIGSFAYMAPERFEHHAAVAPASDIYALACVLYECLTGTPPFRTESNLGTIRAHMLTPPPSPSRHPGVPGSLDHVIATGMAKDPRHRYTSAGQLARAARAALRTALPGEAAPTAVPYPPAPQQHSPAPGPWPGSPSAPIDVQGSPAAYSSQGGGTGTPVAGPQGASASGPVDYPPQGGSGSGPVHPPAGGYSIGPADYSPSAGHSSAPVDHPQGSNPTGPGGYSPQGAQSPGTGGYAAAGSGEYAPTRSGYSPLPEDHPGARGGYSPLPEEYVATQIGRPAAFAGPREHPSAPLPLPPRERSSVPMLVGALVGVVLLLGVILGWVLVSGKWSGSDSATNSAASVTRSHGDQAGGSSAGGGTAGGRSTTAAVTTTLAPWVGSVSGTDTQGFVGGPRCNSDNPAIALGRTAASRVLICRTGVGRYYYKGVRISDGAGIELDDPTSDGSGGFTVTNPQDGTQYRITSSALVITEKSGKVAANETMIEYAHR
ncbi:serine/threonine-protein kinase [Nocardia inohanensis]|uniref:serine/threonine-protein kinase n=1 Tax=Nocardia inohanensis TaxID=209246 RepID=UPI0008354F04|nr:serine/threonine-protein kinase [Nocardia inohanensis]